MLQKKSGGSHMFLQSSGACVCKGGWGGWSRARAEVLAQPSPISAPSPGQQPHLARALPRVLRVSHVAEAAEQLLHQEQGDLLQDGLLQVGCGRRASSVAGGALRGRLSAALGLWLRRPPRSECPCAAQRRGPAHPLSAPSTRSSRPLVGAGRGSGR